MARRESKATGGFFPTPDRVLKTVTSALKPNTTDGVIRVLDPCAGDGRALRALSNIRKRDTHLYGCEMERGRHRAAQLGIHSSHLLRGDFFQVKCAPGFFQIVYLNPPYDQDRETKRLEERFLRAVVPMVAEGGVLVFVVPHYSLSASAATLAQHFEDVQVYRFPEPEFFAFKQVVLFGRRRRSLEPDAQVEAQLVRVAEDATLAPALPEALSYTPVPANDWAGSESWRLAPYDPAEVETVHPWESERGAVPGFAHPLDLSKRIGQVYPVIMPPRPVHLAAALAAGVFNGIHVHPDPEADYLPALLLKGTFERTWSTVDQKFDKDGDLASETQIEKPVLTVWALDLSSARYHELRASGDLTDPQQVEGMTLGDLLDCYSASLLVQLRAACPVLHDPHRDLEQPIEGLARPLWPAQTSALLALSKSLDQGRGGLIVGEVGTGKTSIALALAKQRGHAKVLVICPPHLLNSWADQVGHVVPEYRAVVLDSLEDLRAIVADPQPTVALLSRERAKLGHGWRDLKTGPCPRCGRSLPDGVSDMAEKRGTCSAVAWTSETPLATWFHRHRHLLARLAPTHPAVGRLLGDSPTAKRLLTFAAKHPATNAHQLELDEAVAEIFGADHAGRALIPADARTALVLAAWTRPAVGARGLALLGHPERGEREGYELRQRVALCLDPAVHVEQFQDPNRYDYSGGTDYAAIRNAESWQKWAMVRAKVHGLPVTGHAPYYDYPGFDTGTYRGVPRGSDKALDLLLTDLWEAADFKDQPCGEPLYQAEGPRRYPLATWIARKMKGVFDLFVADECFPGDTRIATPNGERPIRDLRPGDLVWSQAKDGAIVARRVVRHMERPSTKGLVRVTHENGHFDCTPDHKIWSVDADNYVKAASLTTASRLRFNWSETTHANHHEAVRHLYHQLPMLGSTDTRGADVLEVVRRCAGSQNENRNISSPCGGQSRKPTHAETGLRELQSTVRGAHDYKAPDVLWAPMLDGGAIKERDMAREQAHRCTSQGGAPRVQGMGFGEHASGQPGSRGAREGHSIAQGPWMDWAARRERKSDPAAVTASCCNRMANRGTDPNGKPIVARSGCGPRTSNSKDRSGVRWSVSPHRQTENTGSQENRDAGGHGLACFPVLEQSPRKGSRRSSVGTEGGRVVRVLHVEPVSRPDVVFVYDLEIEETHNYFANGVLVSNCHELAGSDSAQGIAAARLAQAHKGDLLYMTGSLVNGYASSAFNVLYAVSPEFRAQFKPDQRDAFVDRYGLRKRVLVYKDAKKTEMRFGAHSERRLVSSTKKGGEAPGVLPVFLLEHLLRSAATLQKADLDLALPSTSEEAIDLALAPEQEHNLFVLLEEVKATIARTRFKAGLSGKLFGALVGMVSYPDLAACGPYTVDWPESAGDLAGQAVISVPSLDPTILWPKERWLLDAIAEERSEGRRVLVAPTHIPVGARLSWLLDQAGIEAVTLHADKVPPSKRERWLNEKLVATGKGVLIANPTTIQTGLNNLVVLSTVVWYENPECNPIRYRQANGRLDRPGQLLPVRFRFPLYQHPLVRNAYKLLMHKVGISLAADGLDPDAVLQAAGVESEFSAGLSVGHQLYRMLVEQAATTGKIESQIVAKKKKMDGKQARLF